jgi:hypothetical protein
MKHPEACFGCWLRRGLYTLPKAIEMLLRGHSYVTGHGSIQKSGGEGISELRRRIARRQSGDQASGNFFAEKTRHKNVAPAILFIHIGFR